tara:strand:- start:560 stop:796 length:237 start_codon:yes stop_codon:yes gene_type:complete
MGFEDIFWNVVSTLLIAMTSFLGSAALVKLFQIPIAILGFLKPFKKLDDLIENHGLYFVIPTFLISFYFFFTMMILGW